MPHLIFEDILIEERVFVLSGKYEKGRGMVCGKTPTMVRVRFDKLTAGKMEATKRGRLLWSKRGFCLWRGGY